jgi:hypothetical protein
MVMVCLSETLVSTDESAWCLNPDHHYHPPPRHFQEDLKSLINFVHTSEISYSFFLIQIW